MPIQTSTPKSGASSPARWGSSYFKTKLPSPVTSRNVQWGSTPQSYRRYYRPEDTTLKQFEESTTLTNQYPASPPHTQGPTEERFARTSTPRTGAPSYSQWESTHFMSGLPSPIKSRNVHPVYNTHMHTSGHSDGTPMRSLGKSATYRASTNLPEHTRKRIAQTSTPVTGAPSPGTWGSPHFMPRLPSPITFRNVFPASCTETHKRTHPDSTTIRSSEESATLMPTEPTRIINHYDLGESFRMRTIQEGPSTPYSQTTRVTKVLPPEDGSTTLIDSPLSITQTSEFRNADPVDQVTEYGYGTPPRGMRATRPPVGNFSRPLHRRLDLRSHGIQTGTPLSRAYNVQPRSEYQFSFPVQPRNPKFLNRAFKGSSGEFVSPGAGRLTAKSRGRYDAGY